MYNFQERYERYLSVFNEYLSAYAEGLRSHPSVLAESMRYSLLAGGKRIRPVLMLATAEALGVDEKEVLPFALALEMIHTYSLIHDDLPAMDNDDFRRGKASNHKAFGEANAILAGDALLNQAYNICFKACLKGECFVVASTLLCEAAGMNGMIVGQSADLYYTDTKKELTEEELFYIHEHKTGKLLLVPVLIPSILAEHRCYIRLEQFGKELGLLFQITDDILDETGDFKELGKTVGKDKQENKLTFVRLYGLDGAMIRADEVAQRCKAILEATDIDAGFLRDLVGYVRGRSN